MHANISRPIPPPIYTCPPYKHSSEHWAHPPEHRSTDNRSSSPSVQMMLSYPSPAGEHQPISDPKSPLPVSPSSEPIISVRGMMCVYQFDPKEGEANLPLTVRLDFRNPYARDSSAVTLRIVFGDIPLHTSMQPLVSPGSPTTGFGDLHLLAVVPPQTTAGPLVKLSVQVTHGQDVLDAVEIGYFAYWGPTSADVDSPPEVVHNSPYIPRLSSPYRVPKRERDDELEGRPFMRAPHDSSTDPPKAFAPAMFGPAPSPAPPPPASPATPAPAKRSTRKTTTLVRTSQLANGHDPTLHQNRINLVIKGDLNSMTMGWSQEDFDARRRLVQFWRRQDGSNLYLAFRSISPEDFEESSIVISCIFREDTDECYITSVDIIFLLECLVANRFTVEEKNRIRRNLEGFKPQTVSKNKRGQEDFFALIMSFPHPRPRNIEKDVKVFPWRLLQRALEKIVNKYSYLPSHGSMVEDGRASSPSPVKEQTQEDDSLSKIEESSPPLDHGYEQMYSNAIDTPPSHFVYSVNNTSAATYSHSSSSSVQSHASTSAVPTPHSRQPSASNYSSSLLDLPPRPSGPHRTGSSSLGGALDYNAGVTDHEVSDFFSSATGYMGTGSGNSPQSLHSELDGINGRSFHHQFQQNQQQYYQQQQQQQHREHQPQAPSTLQQSHSQLSQPLPRPSSSLHPSYSTSYYSPDYRHTDNSNEGLSVPIHRSNPPLYAPTPNSRRNNVASLMLPGSAEKSIADIYGGPSQYFPTYTRVREDGRGSGAGSGSGGGAREADVWVPITDITGLGDNGSSPGIDPSVGISF